MCLPAVGNLLFYSLLLASEAACETCDNWIACVANKGKLIIVVILPRLNLLFFLLYCWVNVDD
jgi:hypothetical protein